MLSVLVNVLCELEAWLIQLFLAKLFYKYQLDPVDWCCCLFNCILTDFSSFCQLLKERDVEVSNYDSEFSLSFPYHCISVFSSIILMLLFGAYISYELLCLLGEFTPLSLYNAPLYPSEFSLSLVIFFWICLLKQEKQKQK